MQDAFTLYLSINVNAPCTIIFFFNHVKVKKIIRKQAERQRIYYIAQRDFTATFAFAEVVEIIGVKVLAGVRITEEHIFYFLLTGHRK